MATNIDGIRAIELSVNHMNGERLYGSLQIALDGAAYDMSAKTVVLEVATSRGGASLITYTKAAGDITVGGDNNDTLTFVNAITLSNRAYYFRIKADDSIIAYGTWKTIEA